MRPGSFAVIPHRDGLLQSHHDVLSLSNRPTWVSAKGLKIF